MYRKLRSRAPQSLAKRLAAVRSALQTAVLDDFKLLMGQADARVGPEAAERLSHACLVANALSPKVGRVQQLPCLLYWRQWQRTLNRSRPPIAAGCWSF